MRIDTTERFNQALAEITNFIDNKQLDNQLEQKLNQSFGIQTNAYKNLFALCRWGREEAWLCTREAGGIEFGRYLKPSKETRNFSVDVVYMDNIIGPNHVHPKGEIDLIMPLDIEARFDNRTAGWLVYGEGSEHAPTVTGGAALILYLLPDGAIEFR